MKQPKEILVRGGRAAIAGALAKYHPVVIEGMGMYDPRDPIVVARQIHSQLQAHWNQQNVKEPIVIVQGDPLQERGISAITPAVADHLNAPRGLVCLDESIADYHIPNADRQNVIIELRYSDLTNILEEEEPGIMHKLETTIDKYLAEKNQRRQDLNKPPLKDYFRHFALLQEVTKAACVKLCNNVTVVHTQQEISEFSVTSFYQVGLDLGLVQEHHMVPYEVYDELDFDKIDTR